MLTGRARAVSHHLSQRYEENKNWQAVSQFAVSLIYGADDWIGPQHGKKLVSALRTRGKADTEHVIIPEVGHQIFVEAPIAFADAIIATYEKYAGAAGEFHSLQEASLN